MESSKKIKSKEEEAEKKKKDQKTVPQRGSYPASSETVTPPRKDTMLAVSRPAFARSAFGAAAARTAFYRAPRLFHSGAAKLNSNSNSSTQADAQKKAKFAAQEIPAKIYSFKEINELVAKPDSSKILVDVREPAELQNLGYIPTALNIPFKSAPGALNLPEDEFEDVFKFQKPSAEKELIFYCQAGVRSTAAEELANTFGYRKRGNYTGSFADWVSNGGKVEKK